MSFTDRCNAVRKRIPFAYWLCYDAVVLPFLVWACASLSWWFAVPLAMLAFAAFFDVNEAIVKWHRKRAATAAREQIRTIELRAGAGAGALLGQWFLPVHQIVSLNPAYLTATLASRSGYVLPDDAVWYVDGEPIPWGDA